MPPSGTASNLEEAMAIAAEIGRLPLIIRPAFTLGGTGGGIAYNMDEFKDQVRQWGACGSGRNFLVRQWGAWQWPGTVVSCADCHRGGPWVMC